MARRFGSLLVAAIVSMAHPGSAAVVEDRIPSCASVADRTVRGISLSDVYACRHTAFPFHVGCMTAKREAVSGDVKTVEVESCGRSWLGSGYRFDPLLWSASFEEMFRSEWSKKTWRNVAGEWQLVETTEGIATSSVSLSWTAQGLSRVDPRVSNFHVPPFCYFWVPFACIPHVEATVARTALVTGSIHFGYLGETVELAGAAGEVSVFLPTRSPYQLPAERAAFACLAEGY